MRFFLNCVDGDDFRLFKWPIKKKLPECLILIDWGLKKSLMKAYIMIRGRKSFSELSFGMIYEIGLFNGWIWMRS